MSPREETATPRTCDARVCRHCRVTDRLRGFLRPRALNTDDLRWHFQEAEAALGLRSTLGAFVDMALSGIQGGGRTNGVENRAVEGHRLDATARHRCIRQRLAHVRPTELEVLRAAYGPDDWTRTIEDLQVRGPARAAYGDLVNVVLLTEAPRAHAARRQAAAVASGAPVVVLGGDDGVRCAYRPAVPPRAPKDRPSQRRRGTGSADAARRLLEADPALAGSARGWAITTACGEDGRRKDALKAAQALLAETLCAAGIVAVASGPSRRTRTYVSEEGRRRPPATPESPYLPSDGEVLAHG